MGFDPRLYSDMVIAVWHKNDSLNPSLQQVHPPMLLCCSILVEFCPSSVFSCTDRRLSTSCDCHWRRLAAYLLYPAVAVRQARLSSHRLQQSDDSASMMEEEHTRKEKHRKICVVQEREVQDETRMETWWHDALHTHTPAAWAPTSEGGGGGDGVENSNVKEMYSWEVWWCAWHGYRIKS